MISSVPVLDASLIPFWRRLPAVVAALDGMSPGESMDLIVDLDPWPLKAHLELTRPRAFDWQPHEQGPQRWRVRLTRR